MQKTLNNLCRYFTPGEMEHNPPMLKCGLLLAIAFQRAQNGKSEKRVTLWLEKPARYDLRQVI